MTPADAMLIFVIALSICVFVIARYQDTHSDQQNVTAKNM